MTEEVSAVTTAELVAEAVSALSPDAPPRRRARRADEADAESAAPQPTTKYMVIGGAISPFGGGRSSLIHPGTVVDLTSAQAKHYNKLGYLKPHIED